MVCGLFAMNAGVEGAENASQQVRGCAAGTLTGRESACCCHRSRLGTFTAKWMQLSTPSGIHRLSRHDAFSEPARRRGVRGG